MVTVIHEHYNGNDASRKIVFENLSFDANYASFFTRKKRNEKIACFNIYSDKNKNEHAVSNSYFIGIDWIVTNEKALYIQPKLNKGTEEQTDYLKMLFDTLKHPEMHKYTDDLFEIKWDAPQVEISQKQDLLTPLLAVQFLKVVHTIVRKGLKKTYYRTEHNLHAKIKGKVLVSKTVKHNLVKNKNLDTFCSYEEFGLNGLENRLLKKTLVFLQHYLSTLKKIGKEPHISGTFNYINPAFENVSAEVSLNEIKHARTNVFFKEYEEAVRLAKLILKRFSYNILNTQDQEKIFTPPFWIDMARLFEVYVLGLLKNKFGDNVEYHFYARGNELDFLLNKDSLQIVIDAKYKPFYIKGLDHNDIKQVSGYARLKKVYKKLNKSENETIDCLIIYPDQENGSMDLTKFDYQPIENYSRMYKIGIRLPVIH